MFDSKEFLQSEEWFSFQEAVGKKASLISLEQMLARGVIEKVSLVGNYLYIPKGPIFSLEEASDESVQKQLQKIIKEAQEKKVKWIRIEPENENTLHSLQKNFSGKVVKAPRDIQPRELFVIDITKTKEDILADMKPKTRYNIRLAEKRGVKIFTTREEKYKQAFYDLVEKTADRKEINPHSKTYYENFFAIFPETLCQLFVAEYEGIILAANICIFFRGRAIYLHGGSSDISRDVMAPYLLQWKQIEYAKDHGCTEYDFGGVHVVSSSEGTNDWGGITRFKTGFSPRTNPRLFPGTYDMILDPMMYSFYKTLRLLRTFFHR
ncbi:MAG: peptidoglycan bridge formation glycyltransferase FemA/FemB family protein [Candidatus Moranbacteria bacterium]|nr:peptidoglycan bridge formation glycyltransferase FemA/FemB family protein [Candidatus Moranbacteria bacterium]OIQ02546.1 MAG: hypothetical protein AUK58_02950 [Candidatus Moranbacteria bacterium CG2_30_41_165]PIP25208.1 MAG: hypothetical protein COX32_04805 [Candidatus Moranbacteria bacterium CG23_combo_of_CG06-09_8_20_14_all_41_28]PIV86676.1 MAG: hypothetical protein COW50_00045 [Candidatus Moranbacteria bacterium CG17_big_fil_post_rev_8_21_14_2_50_41_107]PIW93704.1 MAG: hypothetical protei